MPSLPTPPVKSFDFTSFSTTNPTAQQPGDKLDINLSAGFSYGADLLTWARTVVADTGGLKSGVVTLSSLSPGLLTQITSSITPDLSATITAATAAASQAVTSAALALTYSDTASGHATAASASRNDAQTAAGQATYQAGLALASANLAAGYKTSAENSASLATTQANISLFAVTDSRLWAEYLDGPIPSETLTRSAVSGSYYSSRWYAAAASSSASTATNAAATATAAAGTATSALALVQAAQTEVTSKWNSFRSTYLGPASAAPTHDALGSPVGPGDLYFDTVLSTMRVRNSSSSWSDIGAPDTTAFARWSGGGTYTGQLVLAPGTMAPLVIDAAAQGILVAGLRADSAATATTLATPRTIAVSGDATGSASFDGATDATVPVTLANSGVTAGTYALASVTVDSKGRVTAASSNTAAAINLTNTTASTSPTTGALRVAGGLGIGGAIYAASTLNVAGWTTMNNNLIVNSNSPTIYLKDLNEASAHLRVNNNNFVLATGPTNSTDFVAPSNGRWPLQADLLTGDISLGRNVDTGGYVAIGAAPSADTHAMRRQDVGWERIAGPVSLTGATSVSVTIPSWVKNLQIIGSGMQVALGQSLQDYWLQVQVNGSWLWGANDVYYESRIFQPTGSALTGSSMLDTNGAGIFVARSIDGSVAGAEVMILDLANTGITLSSVLSRSMGDWGGMATWTQHSAGGLIRRGNHRIDAIRIINTNTSPAPWAAGFITVLGTR